MNVKTITAPTIHAALLEARRVLGDDVVLMESIPAQGEEPARITVMADSPSRSARSVDTDARKAAVHAQGASSSPSRPSPHRGRQTGAASKEVNGRAERGRPATGKDVAVLEEESARPLESLAGENGSAHDLDYGVDVGARTLRDVASSGHTSLPEAQVQAGRRGTTGALAGRGNLFPNRRELVEAPHVPARRDAIGVFEELLTAQLQHLHDRLDQMERRFDGAIIGAGQVWTTTPLFAGLLNQGMRPATVTKLFNLIAQKGYQPDTPLETLKWALAQEIRRAMDLSAPRQTSGAQVFIGPAGAGKTSLLLKLATHPEFYGRHETAVIVIAPHDEDGAFHQSPVDLFRRHGLPVQTARNLDEMRRAVTRVQDFGHILIDTPPIPLHEVRARNTLRHVKRLVDPIMPLRVQFVLNATRALDTFDRTFLQGLALHPELVALTHLDEASGLGRIADWLMAIQMPVQFVSSSPTVPDGVTSFSPTSFVEEMMQI